MIGADHHRNGEEGRGGIAGPIEDQPDDTTSYTCERADLEKHVLIKDATA